MIILPYTIDLVGFYLGLYYRNQDPPFAAHMMSWAIWEQTHGR